MRQPPYNCGISFVIWFALVSTWDLLQIVNGHSGSAKQNQIKLTLDLFRTQKTKVCFYLWWSTRKVGRTSTWYFFLETCEASRLVGVQGWQDQFGDELCSSTLDDAHTCSAVYPSRWLQLCVNNQGIDQMEKRTASYSLQWTTQGSYQNIENRVWYQNVEIKLPAQCATKAVSLLHASCYKAPDPGRHNTNSVCTYVECRSTELAWIFSPPVKKNGGQKIAQTLCTVYRQIKGSYPFIYVWVERI